MYMYHVGSCFHGLYIYIYIYIYILFFVLLLFCFCLNYLFLFESRKAAPHYSSARVRLALARVRLLELPTPHSAKHVLLLRIPARHGFVDLCESTGAQRPGSKALGTGSGSGSRVRTGSGLNSADPGGVYIWTHIYIYIYIYMEFAEIRNNATDNTCDFCIILHFGGPESVQNTPTGRGNHFPTRDALFWNIVGSTFCLVLNAGYP